MGKSRRRNAQRSTEEPRREQVSSRQADTDLAIATLRRRLARFKLANLILYWLCTGGMVYAIYVSRDTVRERLTQVPTWVLLLFLATWGAVTLHRAYFGPRGAHALSKSAKDYSEAKRYYRFQVVSSLTSLACYVAASTYVTGALRPISSFAAERLGSISPTAIETVLSVAIPLFWSVVGNAIWDGIKSLYRRAQNLRRR